MKSYLHQLVDGSSNKLFAIGLAREYLQARVLQGFQEDGIFIRWAFLGGTALRFLYSIPRFSEDLDFSVVQPNKEVGLRSAMRRVQSNFKSEGYTVTMKINDRKVVASGLIRFPGLLYELDLSPHRSQVFSIKIEIDTNPPLGGNTTTTLIRRHVTLNLNHYDKPSLLAAKIHAVLTRPWAKGRDVYDIFWYVSDRRWPEPNLGLLNEALKQTQWTGPEITPANWRTELVQAMEAMDWNSIRADVRPFLERQEDMQYLTFRGIKSILEESPRSQP